MGKENETKPIVSTAKAPSIIKQAMAVNRKPFPWFKAFCAGCSSCFARHYWVIIREFRIWAVSRYGRVYLSLRI